MATNEITVHKITQSNAYLDGNNMMGKTEEVDLPDFKFIFEEFKAMGMFAKTELPTHALDKLGGKIKFNSLYPDITKTISPFKSRQLQLRSSVNVFNNGGLARQIPLVTFMTVYFKTIPTGQYGQHKNVDGDYEYSCTYFKQVFDGHEVLEVDTIANIFKVNGEDMLKEYRENLGM